MSPERIQKHQKRLLWAIVASETSHVFCCVLPTLFSLVALLSGFGMVITLPGWLEVLHDELHHYELPMIIFSAAVLALGWGLQMHSWKIDCHDTGCHHGSCKPRKRAASKILIAASVLFTFNVILYFGFHRNNATLPHAQHNHAQEHQSSGVGK
ncbi:MAG: hypothetical protein KDI46_09905 [Alphaproteobacteria bacterium]|nr:hypothetical protein [Alphaproteobacteria bacterium]